MTAEEQLTSESLYELVYEGPADDAPRTLQLIKGVFVADLNLPIPEVQRIIEHAPVAVTSAPSEAELKESYAKLKSAGARVLILKRGESGQEESPDELLKNLLAQSDQEEAEVHDVPPPSVPEDSGDSSGEGLSFEFELDADAQAPRKQSDSPPKVYSLDLDEAENSLDVLKEFGVGEPASEEPQNPAPKAESTPVPKEVDLSNSFTLLSEEELKEFHKARGGSLEDVPHHESYLHHEEQFEDFESTLKDSLSSDLHPAPETAPQVVDLSNQLPDKDTAAEVALVLSEVSSILEDSSSASPTTTPASTPRETQRAAPVEPAKREAFETQLSLDEPEEKASPTPPSKTAPKPVATSAATPSLNLSFEEPVAVPESAAAAPQPAQKESRPATPPPPPASTPHATEAPVTTPVASADTAQAPRVAAIAPVRRPKKSKLSWLEFGIPIIIGSSILGLANWFYFAGGTPTSSSTQLIASPSALEPAAAPTKRAVVLPPTSTWEGALDLEDRRIGARVTETQGKMILSRLAITNPPQRLRTNEEIANNIILPPWLRRAEASNLVLTAIPETTGRYTLEGPMFFYIEYDSRPQRFVGAISGTVYVSAEKPTLSVSFNGRLAALPSTTESPFTAERAKDGSFGAVARGDVEIPRAQAAPAQSKPF